MSGFYPQKLIPKTAFLALIMMLCCSGLVAASGTFTPVSFAEECNTFSTSLWGASGTPPTASGGYWTFSMPAHTSASEQVAFHSMTGYGTYELRLKTINTRQAGVNWCIFLYGDKGDHNQGQMELDFAEVFGSHTPNDYSLSIWVNGKTVEHSGIGYWFINTTQKGVSFDDGNFHVFTYVYTPSDVVTYIDGIKIFDWQRDCTNKTALGLPTPPMQFVIGLSGHGTQALAASMIVDYIHYTAMDDPSNSTIDTSTTDFGANFHIMALNGETISTNNSTFSSSISPTVTFNTAAQYCNATFYIDKNSVAGWSTLEITVPDDYMGLNVYAYGGGAWNLMTGNGNYSLSVPYATGSSTPAYDWGTNGATKGSGTDGIQKRVQLMVYLKANQNIKLQIQIYYATNPAVGFDGVNDYAQFPNSAALQIVGNFQLQVVMKVLSQGSGGVLNKRYANEYAISLSPSGYGNFYWGNGSGYTGKGNPDNYIRYVGVVTNWTWERNIANLYGWSYLNGVLGGNYSYAQNVASSTSPVQIGLYSNAYLKAEVYNLSLYNTLNTSGLVLFVNPSSFSGGSNTAVNDFSGNAAIGTAYGNVQYKVWTNYGFQFTLLDT